MTIDSGGLGAEGQEGLEGGDSHGGRGGRGGQGGMGIAGPRGPKGEAAVAPLILRHITKVFLVQLAGVVLALWLSWSAVGKASEVGVRNCEAGNTRSQVQLEDFAETARMTASLDLERLFGIDAETAAEFRALSLSNAQRRIERLPFLDCKTGERVPPPPMR